MLGKTFYKFNKEKLPVVTIDDRLWILAEVVDDLYRRKYGGRKLHNPPKPSKISMPDKEGLEEEARASASSTAPREPEDRPSADPAASPTIAAQNAEEIESAGQVNPAREAASVSSKTIAERLEEDRRRVTEAAQRLGKSTNQVRQMIVAGQLVPDLESGRLVTPNRGSDDPADNRAAEKKPSPSRPALTEAQELEEKVRALRDELRTEKEEKEHLSEELERERAEHFQDVSDTQRHIDQIEAELENAHRDYAARSETLQRDLEEERSGRLESERRVRELQEWLDKEEALKPPNKESPEDAPSNETFYGRLRSGVRGVVESLKDSEHPSSELEELKAELEKERERRLVAEESLADYYGREEYEEQLAALRSELEEEKENRQRTQSCLKENETEKKALEEVLSSEKEKTHRLETDKRLLDDVRRLLGAAEAGEPSEPDEEVTSENVPEDDTEEASGELILKTPFGQVSFLPPFPLNKQDEELLRLIAREDELTADQIRNLTGRRRAKDHLEHLLDSLADEGVKNLVEEVSEDRYRFNPAALQND